MTNTTTPRHENPPRNPMPDTSAAARAFVVNHDHAAFRAGTIVYEDVRYRLEHADDEIPAAAWPGQSADALIRIAELEEIRTCGQRAANWYGEISEPCAFERDHPHHSSTHRTAQGISWEDTCGECHHSIDHRRTMRTPATGPYAGILFCGDCFTKCKNGGTGHTCKLCGGNPNPEVSVVPFPVGWRAVETIRDALDVPSATVPDLAWRIEYRASYEHFRGNHDNFWRLTVKVVPTALGLDLDDWSASADGRAHIPLHLGGAYVLPGRAGIEHTRQAVKEYVQAKVLPSLAAEIRGRLLGGEGQRLAAEYQRTATQFSNLRAHLTANYGPAATNHSSVG
jgi:hypothetical protein